MKLEEFEKQFPNMIIYADKDEFERILKEREIKKKQKLLERKENPKEGI